MQLLFHNETILWVIIEGLRIYSNIPIKPSKAEISRLGFDRITSNSHSWAWTLVCGGVGANESIGRPQISFKYL